MSFTMARYATARFSVKEAREATWARRIALFFVQLLILTVLLHHFATLATPAAINLLIVSVAGLFLAILIAIASLTRTWALELARDGITVNAIAPGPIETELFRENSPADSPQVKALIAAVPVGRIGQPADVAAAAAFFLSDEASFITGQVLYVCGGLSIYSAPM